VGGVYVVGEEASGELVRQAEKGLLKRWAYRRSSRIPRTLWRQNED
jgi:hypothetical protein